MGERFQNNKFRLFLLAFIAIGASIFCNLAIISAVRKEDHACDNNHRNDKIADIGFWFHEKSISLSLTKIQIKCYGFCKFPKVLNFGKLTTLPLLILKDQP
jgi:hypothetical protein